jgi:hypothetical protein
MTKVFRYSIAYFLWIVDLGLGIWLFLLGRSVLLGVLALSYKPGALTYAHRVDFVDKMYVLLLGLAWLALMIVLEHQFRTSALTENLPQRFAKVTGILLLSVFVIDSILFWLQGVASGNWLRWLILAAELGIGIWLIVAVQNRLTSKL